jgi:hypothetical protein
MSKLYDRVCMDCANKHIVPINGKISAGSMRCCWCAETQTDLYRAEDKVQVKLTYFKPNGKYYSSGDFWITGLGVPMDEIFDLVEQKAVSQTLPGFEEGHGEFIVLVNVLRHPHNFPALINTEAVLMQAKKRLVSLQPSRGTFRQGW